MMPLDGRDDIYVKIFLSAADVEALQATTTKWPPISEYFNILSPPIV